MFDPHSTGFPRREQATMPPARRTHSTAAPPGPAALPRLPARSLPCVAFRLRSLLSYEALAKQDGEGGSAEQGVSAVPPSRPKPAQKRSFPPPYKPSNFLPFSPNPLTQCGIVERARPRMLPQPPPLSHYPRESFPRSLGASAAARPALTASKATKGNTDCASTTTTPAVDPMIAAHTPYQAAPNT